MLSEQNAVSSHVIPVCMLHLVFIPIFRLSIEQLMYVNNLRRRAVVGRPTKGCLLEKRVGMTAGYSIGEFAIRSIYFFRFVTKFNLIVLLLLHCESVPMTHLSNGCTRPDIFKLLLKSSC